MTPTPSPVLDSTSIYLSATRADKRGAAVPPSSSGRRSAPFSTIRLWIRSRRPARRTVLTLSGIEINFPSPSAVVAITDSNRIEGVIRDA